METESTVLLSSRSERQSAVLHCCTRQEPIRSIRFSIRQSSRSGRYGIRDSPHAVTPDCKPQHPHRLQQAYCSQPVDLNEVIHILLLSSTNFHQHQPAGCPSAPSLASAITPFKDAHIDLWYLERIWGCPLTRIAFQDVNCVGYTLVFAALCCTYTVTAN